MTTLCGNYHPYLHSADEEMEVQEVKWPAQSYRAKK